MKHFSDFIFDDFVDNCEVLKEQYSVLLTPFFNLDAIKCWKKMVYSLDLKEWQKNLIWEVLNDDITIEALKSIAQQNRMKKNNKN